MAKRKQRMESGGEAVREQMARLHLKARKSLGQNFLIDGTVLDDVVKAADLTPEDVVLEVGPGLGVLTSQLARLTRRVIAVEVDTRLAEVLKRSFNGKQNVVIVNADILQTPPSGLLSQFAAETSPAAGYKVVANLPYYITSPVLHHFLEASVRPSLMVVMVQKEVGEAIAASPGKMSLLAVTVQYYAVPSVVRLVPASCFHPAPKVDSAVLRLEVRKEPVVKVADVEDFFGFVRAGFSSKRKQLHNPLAHSLGMPVERVASLLKKGGIDPQRRAESLSLPEWAIIYGKFRAEVDYQGARKTEPGAGSAR